MTDRLPDETLDELEAKLLAYQRKRYEVFDDDLDLEILAALLATARRERELEEENRRLREACEAWLDWCLREPENAGRDVLDVVIVDCEPPAARQRMCDYCCCSPEVEGERKHPWHYDDCPVYLVATALEDQ